MSFKKISNLFNRKYKIIWNGKMVKEFGVFRSIASAKKYLIENTMKWEREEYKIIIFKE